LVSINEENSVVFCYSASRAIDGKINLNEVIPRKKINAQVFPYNLEFTAVAFIHTLPLDMPVKIHVYLDGKKIREGEETGQIKSDTKWIGIILPAIVEFTKESKLEIRFLDGKDKLLCKSELEIFQGPSPVLSGEGSPAMDSILGPNSNPINLENIIKRSRESIVIIDSYVDSEDWQKILDSRKDKKIRTIIGIDNSESECKKLQSQYPDFQYKIIKNTKHRPYFHDRFLVIDDTEFYHVGQSLKDIGKSVGRFARLSNLEEVEELRKHIKSNWSDIYD